MATAYICPECVFNCDNLPDLERHLEAHENNSILSPVKQQNSTVPIKSARNSPLYAKPQALLNLQQHISPKSNGLAPIRSSPGKTYDRRYSCKMCPFSTHSAKAYFNHRQMAHDEQLLVTECPFCDYASQYPGKVKKHLTDEHPMQQTATATESPIRTNRPSENVSNGKLSSETPRFTDCPFCSFTSMEPEAFRERVLINHLSDKNFRCLVCNRLYRYRGDCSFHIRKKHPECMVNDNIESLREYISEFQPTSMSSTELKELLSCPLTPSLASAPANAPPTTPRPSPSVLQRHQPNPPHAFRCGYCKFSSVNSGDVKKHQTWKHAQLNSNIIPIDPNDPEQQPIVSYKRKRGQSNKNSEDDAHIVRRPRTSMPTQRDLTVDTSPPTMVRTPNNSSPPKDLLSPNEVPSTSFECDQCTFKTTNAIIFSSHQATHKLSASSRVYKCTLCDRLAPHRWIIERHVRAKHPSESEDIIMEIDAQLPSSNGEPLMATKSSSSNALLTSSNSDQDALAATSLKAFSCSACALQSYHLWVVLRHIRHFHDNDGSNAKIIDNYNNRVIEDTDDLELDAPVSSVSSTTTTTTTTISTPNGTGTGIASDRDDEEMDTQQHDLGNEDMLKRLMSTAMITRKSNTIYEDASVPLTSNNMAASLVALLGQLTQQQQQQQQQMEKAPMIKRYKCSLCSHISAWGGNVKKHLKRMHPGNHSGHVIDIGLELAAAATTSSLNTKEESNEMINDTQLNTIPPALVPEINHHHQKSSTDLIINTKLKDIDNSPSIIPPTQSSSNPSQSSRPERLYACSVCSVESTNQNFIHRHVELHGDDGGFQCSQCCFLSKWRASIRKHMMSMHGSSFASLTNVVEPLTLNKSDEATVIVKKWILRENNVKHEDDPNNNSTHAIDIPPHYCTSCPYTSDTRSLFEQHLAHHDAPTKYGDETTIYMCTFCSYNTIDEDILDDHRKLHIIEEDFQQNASANAVENAAIV